MPRFKKLIHRSNDFSHWKILNKFTHRMIVGDRVLLGDPEAKFWGIINTKTGSRQSWLGNPPEEWDDVLSEKYEFSYTENYDEYYEPCLSALYGTREEQSYGDLEI